MVRIVIAACAGALLGAASAAQEIEIDNRFNRDTARPVLDFDGVQGNLAQGPTPVLVLGSMHLAGREDEIPREHLAALLDRLEAWNPAIIATEDTAGRHCDLLDSWPEQYRGVARRYCADPAPAAETLGLSRAEAEAEIHASLSRWPENPSAAERRRLAALFWAHGDDSSAVLQWMRLPEDERIADDTVSPALLEALNARARSNNESVSIGAALGARLGLERVHPMDDRSADILLERARPEAGPAIQRVWDADVNGANAVMESALQPLGSPEGVLEHYRILNSARYQQATLDADFASVAAQPDGNGAARAYLAWYQARGLRMAANVIEAAANHPGERVLIIVGASHKAYFEAYLDAMHDVEIVPVDTVVTD